MFFRTEEMISQSNVGPWKLRGLGRLAYVTCEVNSNYSIMLTIYNYDCLTRLLPAFDIFSS